MSEGTRGVLALVAVMTACAAATARAQDVREFTRRLDVAVSLHVKASKDLAKYRRDVANARVYPDTIPLLDGSVLVVTTHDVSPVVRAALTLVDSFLRPRFGPAASRLRGSVLSVRPDTATKTDKFVIIGRRSVGSENFKNSARLDPMAISRVVEEQVQSILLWSGPPAARKWSGVPIDTTTDLEWAAVRVELVSSPALIDRACYSGSVDACKAALGLTNEPAPLTSWYDAAGRRALVHGMWDDRRVYRVARDRCIAGSDAECLAVLRADGTLGSEPPASGHARATLMARAIAIGGSNSLDRLVSSSGSVADALGATAAVPLDSVVATWLRRVHGRKAESENFSPTIGLVAIGWVLLMGGLALRSTRWR
jgi:hypothetical protein